MKTILSLFDYTGNWSNPYRKAGYNVIQHDIKTGQDIFTHTLPAAIADHLDGRTVHGILAALPCTDFALSGARWWPGKDQKSPFIHYPGRIAMQSITDVSVTMASTVLFLVELLKPVWWVIENPVGRLHKLVPETGEPLMYFQPTEFGHPYTKKTALYGSFNTNLPRTYALNLFGSEMHTRYGGRSEKTKAARSVTPAGFAKAFFIANP